MKLHPPHRQLHSPHHQQRDNLQRKTEAHAKQLNSQSDVISNPTRYYSKGLVVFLILVIIHSKAIKAGDWVLTQGTGGAGLAAIQFAAAAVATVVSTMPSNEKAETLKELGASYIINYRKDSS
ncbi:hypothetical protein FOXG_22183 [Fusarium oxysporum f. sp. lycopersici 4287]|uniref:Alcohol dehydrogenase-like C-terminal domain-containing protein n=1 Tax=Fusarium oxysporum f. sp. lycopersici (strain 4287 / CBS 123668 / FGSC 9935 / NRRL 34936) TaxID=426428 RepID=A0A0J9W5I0_FUSO4|nr:hypothetical protein FOXG_22049 [Fusarium oxysporum f. sp. lycopersici 4287]XP_018256344.1 uncharacterized protein FOXG_22183 [Fusarium oxysporum f. sp. lycopersici 4287]KNB17786.1 hypothetical protein FOXG_22049 [Fusarium oxysporum f. sp. lycopersici 4287]KNB18299.1 hypothetical protein FOXG_22183 [Fusarium oxysporum f. sp. lycopersici 4287]